MSDRLIRVCMMVPLPPPTGGIGRWASLVKQYAHNRSDVLLHIVNTNPYGFRNFHDIRPWKRILGGGVQLIRDSFLLVITLLMKRCHVIHITTSGQFGVVRDLCVMTVGWIFRVPVIYHIHFGRVPEIAATHSREWQLLTHAMRMSYMVVVIDAITERAIQKYLPDVLVENIPNCININDLPAPIENSDTVLTVMFLGWVSPTKGVGELLEAWGRLQSEDWNLQLVGAVDDTYQQELKHAYNTEKVTFFGEVSHEEAMELLAKADVFVLPSYTEGFPNVVLEAMALGKPIVATSVGAIPEMLSDECGVLVPPKNSAALGDGLLHVLSNPKLRIEMGKRAKIRAEKNFSIDWVFNIYLSIWRQACGRKGS